MKSTIPLQGDKKAVIDLPYSKIMAAQVSSKGAVQQESSCCDSRIIIGTVGGKSKQNIELKKMIDQLELEYERDMRQKDDEIRRLKQERKQYLSTQKIQIGQIQIIHKAKCESYQHQLKALREERSKKQQQLAKIREEKQLILRNKINEFKQIEYIDRMNEQQRIIRLKDIEIQELISKLRIFKEEKNHLEDQLECAKAKYGSQVSKITQHLTQLTNKFTSQHKQYSYSSKVRQEQSSRISSSLKQEINFLQINLKEIQFRLDSKNRQLLLELQNNKRLDAALIKKSQQIQNLTSILKEINNEKSLLLKAEEQKDFLISQYKQEREKLILSVAQKQEEINRLKIQLSSKEKVYEVKIQRVIDGKQQIAQLQSAVFELQQQLKQLSLQKNYLAQDLLKKQKQFDELLAAKFKLEGQIIGLKGYITKRQGSFKWVVQRQIQRDMTISQQQPQLYKVSQIRQFSREPEKNANRVIAQQIAVNMQANLFSGFTENLEMGNMIH